ncbi:hypothetical protein [Pseudoalteromonas gelatinilytica]
MTKEQKAKAIISYLGNTDLNWISYDASLRGYIGFRVEGVTEQVLIPSFFSVTSGREKIAEAIKEAGLNYGHYAIIIDEYEKNLEFRRERGRKRQQEFEKVKKELAEIMEEKVQERVRKVLEERGIH